MQKKIIALAVAGLMSSAAFAQSTVTISGLARMSYNQDRVTGLAAGTESSAEHYLSDQSSMLVFSVREELGGGMYAGVNIDNRWSGDQGAFGATGNTNMHLGGTWGKVSMGRQDLHYGSAIESYKAYTLQNILGSSLFTQVNGTAVAVGSRSPNVAWYDSPNMSGFSARLAMGTAAGGAGTEGSSVRAAGAADGSKGSLTNLALNYANGPIVAGYSYWRSTNEGGKGATAATADQRGDTLQFGYTFPMGLKLGAAWNKSRLETTVGDFSRTAWLLPVSYTWGANQVAFTYIKAGNTTNVTDSDAKAYTLAYGYSLSKRTNVGAAYTKMNNNTGATYNLFGAAGRGAVATVAGQDVGQFSLNMNHSF